MTAYSSNPPSSSLLLPTTTFIGRDSELAALDRTLGDPACRLVTIVGPGGIGKTRLALEALHRYGARFSDGACAVDLTAVTNLDLIPETIADALGVVFSGSDRPREQLARYLRERSVLIMLDNMEHMTAAADLVADMLRAARRLHLLVTSREPLHLQDETIVELRGLPIATHVRAPMNDQGALGLFLQRARRARQDFAPTRDDLAAIQQICRRVEGMPLGIELAAAWVRNLSCGEIARELNQSYDAIVARARDIPARHRSLGAVFEHSWQLLDAIERQTLRRVAIFRGGFIRQSAVSVLNGDSAAGSTATLAVLTSLVDKSLLRLDRGPGDASRYTLHEVIRQHALARLNEYPDEYEDMRRRHATYYAEWIAGQEAILKSAAQREALQAIGIEMENLRAAWQWAIERREPEIWLAMAHPIAWFWEVRGWWRDGAAMLEQACTALKPAIAQTNAPEAAQRAYWLMITLEGWNRIRFDPAHADQLLQSAIEPLRRLGDQRALHQGLIAPAYMLLFAGDYDRAQPLLEEAVELARMAGYRWEFGVDLTLLGLLEVLRGNRDGAMRQLTECLNITRAIGDPRIVGLGLAYFGMAALALNRFDRAELVFRESFTLASEQKDRYMMSSALRNLGHIAHWRADQTTARYLLNESLTLAREIGDSWLETQALVALSGVARAEQQIDEARRLLLSAARSSAQAPLHLTLDTLHELALFELTRGAIDGALVLLAYVTEHPATNPSTRAAIAKRQPALASELGAARLAAAHAYAQTLTPAHPADLLGLMLDPGFRLNVEAAPPTTAARSVQATPLVEPLTEREQEILRLLAQGRSNQQIANELILAVGTVKRHVNNILGKLDVQSRLAAVARARELDLI